MRLLRRSSLQWLRLVNLVPVALLTGCLSGPHYQFDILSPRVTNATGSDLQLHFQAHDPREREQEEVRLVVPPGGRFERGWVTVNALASAEDHPRAELSLIDAPVQSVRVTFSRVVQNFDARLVEGVLVVMARPERAEAPQ